MPQPAKSTVKATLNTPLSYYGGYGVMKSEGCRTKVGGINPPKEGVENYLA